MRSHTVVRGVCATPRRAVARATSGDADDGRAMDGAIGAVAGGALVVARGPSRAGAGAMMMTMMMMMMMVVP